ncbi:MAG: ISAs1 family transposase [Caldilineaceae bacterium]|nr:ISAs1 family transposase [Caldilineaceae bacterium]
MAAPGGDRADGLRPLHMVSAFLVREGLTLAQEPCDAKSNEITAIPRLLDRIHLEEAVVTIDAAGCQTAIVQALREAGADYVLAVKRNQPTLHREVKAVFDEAERGTFAPQAEDRCETVERNGGRRERRTCTVLSGPGLGEWVADPKTWPDLRSLVRVQAERTGPRGRRQRSVRYYISSRSPKAEALLALVRGHWRGPSGRGNGLHRTLDVQFREDDCLLRRGHAPAVMAILHRAALNMVKTFQQPFEPDVSMGLLRDRIGRQP